MVIKPVTSQNLDDLIQLFEAHGNTNYCWCMTWRMSGSQFRTCNSKRRKNGLIEKVKSNIPIGLLGYINEKPIAWCSAAPRETYPRLERARSIKKIDNQNTWSIVCLFIKPAHRSKGYSLKLLKAAIKYASSEDAEVIEGYPVKPDQNEDGEMNYKVSYRFMGFVSTFQKAGFKDVTPPDSSRRVMRFEI